MMALPMTHGFTPERHIMRLLALRSIGFLESVTTMIDKTWSRRKCHVKAEFGVLARSYRSTLEELIYGLGQLSTSATGIWVIIHRIVMHALELSFIGIIILSVAKRLQHKRIDECFIGDAGMGTTKPHYTAITQMSKKTLTNEERELHTKANRTLQLFLDLLNVIGLDIKSA
jgi:hypothetical protein